VTYGIIKSILIHYFATALIYSFCEGSQESIQPSGTYATRQQAEEEETEEEGPPGLINRPKKRGGPHGPPGARNAGRLGYRVPPAAISRDVITSRACDCVTCPARNWEG
jgi:hypothetical protein